MLAWFALCFRMVPKTKTFYTFFTTGFTYISHLPEALLLECANRLIGELSAREDTTMTRMCALATGMMMLICTGIACAEDATEQSKFDLSGSFRVRGENWNNFLFRQDASDDFGLLRFLLNGDYRPTDTTRVFAQVKLADSTNRDLPGGHRPIDVDTFALQQAWFEVRPGGGQVAVRAGRISLAYGKERLVSPLPWGNTLRAWDGAKLTADVSGWDVDAFWTYYVPVDRYDWNTADSDLPFGGVYANRKLGDGNGALDVYWLHNERPFANFNGTEGPERRETFGARIARKIGGFDIDLEAALQRGRVGAGDIRAAMLALEVVRPIGDTGASFLAGFDYASGDETPGGNVGTFHSLYPLAHAYLGFIDAIGRQNVVSAHIGTSVRLGNKPKLGVKLHTFRRAETADALYHAGGGVVLPPDASDSRHIGEELDLTLTIPIAKSVLLAGYSHFFKGTFLDEAGAAETDFGYLQFLLNF